MNRLKAALPLLLLIAIGGALYFGGALDLLAPRHLMANQAQLRELIDANPWLARATLVTAMTLAVATGIPGTIFLVLAAGFLFGAVEGTVYTWIGLLAGSLLLFLASRHAFASGQRQPPELVQRVRDGYLHHPVSYTFFLRLVPVLPFGGITIALAWLRCPLWLFVLASATAGSLMLAFETAIGAGLAAYIAGGNALSFTMLLEPYIALPMLALALLALVPAAFNWHVGRRRRRGASSTADNR